MGARRRLQGHCIHAADFRQAILQSLLHFERALDHLRGQVGMRQRETFQAGHSFVDLRIVFHRAGAKRIQPEIDVIVPGRNPGEMTDHVNFTEFGHRRDLVTQKL